MTNMRYVHVCDMWWSPLDKKTFETLNRASGGVKRIFHENIFITYHWNLIKKERPIGFHLERMSVVLNWGCGLLMNTCVREGRSHVGIWVGGIGTSGACIDVEIKRSLILGVARGVPSLSRPPRNTCNISLIPTPFHRYINFNYHLLIISHPNMFLISSQWHQLKVLNVKITILLIFIISFKIVPHHSFSKLYHVKMLWYQLVIVNIKIILIQILRVI